MSRCDGVRAPTWTRCSSCALTICSCFPSRRRHTRCYRDWSSDVVSSDLVAQMLAREDFARRYAEGRPIAITELRSEERRVGKKGRSRWAPYHYKKKEEHTPVIKEEGRGEAQVTGRTGAALSS